MGNPLGALKDKAMILDVIGNIKNSPYCKQHLAAIVRYSKATNDEKKFMDASAIAEQCP